MSEPSSRSPSHGNSPLDRDLIGELGASLPPAVSSLSVDALHAHDAAILQASKTLIAREEASRRIMIRVYQILSVMIALLIISVLLIVVLDLPLFGRSDNPVNNEVSSRYLSSGLAEGGATNLVANLILDYRAFDTLGESNVLFAAACTVLLLLWGFSEEEDRRLSRENTSFSASRDPVLRAAGRLLVPVILLFGVYIILNGHLGPGGGFSGGAVMGAGLILYLSVFGPGRSSSFFTVRTFRAVSASALGFYALSKAWSFFTGANGLESGISPGTPGSLFSGGLILPLNVAVGLVVCCTMYAFFSLFQRGDI